MTIIECRGLRKQYGKFTAVNDLSFTVEEGEIVGFVGPNGAGKTTTMKIMAGLSRPTEGEITLFGKTAGGAAPGGGAGAPGGAPHVSPKLGYMPDDPAFSSWVTPLAHLEFLGGFFFQDKKTAREKAEESIKLFGLEKLKNRKAGGFSKGERQRLALAHAMTGSPSILVMDEPTSGLDPIGRRQLLDYIDGLKGRTTIIFSTHLLADVELVCDHVLMIDRGRLIADDTIAGLRQRYDTNTLWVEVEGDPGALLERLRSSGWCERAGLKDSGIEAVTRDPRAAAMDVPAAAVALGLGIRNLRMDQPDLEEVFMRALEEKP